MMAEDARTSSDTLPPGVEVPLQAMPPAPTPQRVQGSGDSPPSSLPHSKGSGSGSGKPPARAGSCAAAAVRIFGQYMGVILGTLALAVSLVALSRTFTSPPLQCPCSAVTGEQPSPARVGAETLIFMDNFTNLDLSMWEHEITAWGGGNWEFEYYTNNRSNSFVKDGALHIRPTLTMDTLGVDPSVGGTMLDLYGTTPADECTGPKYWGCQRTTMEGNIVNPIQSARLRTAKSLTFKYGRVEFRARLPKGDWLWPALWMLPRYNPYGTWPTSGEIDIMESRGNLNYPDSCEGGVNTMSSTLHWGPAWNRNGYPLTHALKKLSDGTYNDGFHVFGLYWDASKIETYIDTPSNVVLSVDTSKKSFWDRGLSNSVWSDAYANPWVGRPLNAPFDQEFFLLINLAVGGVTDYWRHSEKPWTKDHAATAFWANRAQWLPSWAMDTDQRDLIVDWVKVWALPESSYTIRGVQHTPV